MTRRVAVGVVAMLGAVVSACSVAPVDDTEGASAPIVGVAETTRERPEIGHFDDCTGTLVAPRVVLSAAHCFDFRSGVRDLGDFTIDLAGGGVARFAAVEVVVYGNNSGEDDLALVRLGAAVPRATATPAPLASERPERAENVAMWGYGCTMRPVPPLDLGNGVVLTGNEELFGKRKFEYPYGERTKRGCQGDSGGPRTSAAGAVFEVNSSYYQDRDILFDGPDFSADVVSHHDVLAAQIARW